MWHQQKNTNNFPETDLPNKWRSVSYLKIIQIIILWKFSKTQKNTKKLNELIKQYMNKTGVQQSNVNHKKNQIGILKVKNKMY